MSTLLLLSEKVPSSTVLFIIKIIFSFVFCFSYFHHLQFFFLFIIRNFTRDFERKVYVSCAIQKKEHNASSTPDENVLSSRIFNFVKFNAHIAVYVGVSSTYSSSVQ